MSAISETGPGRDMASPGGDQKQVHSLSLISWGLNEEDSVEAFLDKAFTMLDAVAEEAEVIFVNDGSTDRTGEIVDAYAKAEPRLRVLHNEKNRNVAISCRRAIKLVRTDYFFWQTVDWSYDLENLPIFLSLLSHYDVVHGVRPYPERPLTHIPVVRSLFRVKTRSDNLRKALISLSNYYMVRLLYGARFHDFQNITFFPTKLVQALDLRATTPFLSSEILMKLYANGHCFIEVPIGFLPRRAGVSKGTRFGVLVRSFLDIIGNWFVWGWTFRFSGQSKAGSIVRVREPVFIDEPVLSLIVPLLKYYR